MEKRFKRNSYTFGINGGEQRAIQIGDFRVLCGKNGNALSVTHRDGEKTNIILADTTMIYIDKKNRFIGLPYGHVAFEVPNILEDLNEEIVLEIVRTYLKEKTNNDDLEICYLGIVHQNQNGYQIDKPASTTVEKVVMQKYQEIQAKEKEEQRTRKMETERIKREKERKIENDIKRTIEDEARQRESRRQNPTMFISQYYDEISKKTYFYGNIVDVRTGDILRLREIESFENNRYSGYIDRTHNEDDVELLDPKAGGFKKINFTTRGETLDKIAKEGNIEKIKNLSGYLSQLLDKQIQREQDKSRQGEER